MSRMKPDTIFKLYGVPRASGDEPKRSTTTAALDECSPRERG